MVWGVHGIYVNWQPRIPDPEKLSFKNEKGSTVLEGLYVFYPSIQEAEVGQSLWARGQSGVQIEFQDIYDDPELSLDTWEGWVSDESSTQITHKA